MDNNQNYQPKEINVAEEVSVRKEKLANLQAAGKNPFEITKFARSTTAGEIKKDVDSLLDKEVVIAGRLMSKRVMGKASFGQLQDTDGIIQLYFTRDNLGEENYGEFKKVLDRSYETLKIQNTLVSCSIYLGIYFGMSFLMGLIMFLLTRGKKNPNNYFSLWLCLKIQARLGFCPGLITMIAGFFLVTQTPIIFVMTIGLRVMWISMKELRPVQA